MTMYTSDGRISKEFVAYARSGEGAAESAIAVRVEMRRLKLSSWHT